MLCVAVVHGMRLVRTKGPNDHWGSWRRLRRAGALRIAGGGTLALHVVTTHRPLTRRWPPRAGASLALLHALRLNYYWDRWRGLWGAADALRIAGGGTLALHVIATHGPLTRCWPLRAGASLALLHALRLNYHWNRWRGLWDADALRIETAEEGILAHAALATRGHLQTWASTYSAFLLALLLLPLLL